MADIVQIMLTNDRFESEILAEAVKAEGYIVELVHRDDGGTVSGAIGYPSHLLARAADVDAIRALLSRSHES